VFFYRVFEGFSEFKQTGDISSDMEKIGDRETAIANRVRALLEAANSTAAVMAGTAVPSGSVVRSASAPVTRSSRRLDPPLDPATVLANLTAAGIQLAVSSLIFYLTCGSVFNLFKKFFNPVPNVEV
jgi:hypothetical protein